MGYNGSLTAECWKVHTCVNCGTVLRYGMKRHITSTGNTEQQARENLQTNAVNTMTNGVDVHPCPGCGMVQPEMVASRRAGTLTWPTGLGFVVTICMAVAMWMEVSISTIVIAGLIAGGLCAAIAVLGALDNPNTNLAGNLRIAQQRIQKGQLFNEGIREDSPEPKNYVAHYTSGGNPAAFATILVGLLLLGSPEAARSLSGWPANRAWFPAVVGPGDTATYYFNNSFNSIKGYWRGEVTAVVTSKIKKGDKLSTSTNTNSWGDSISVKSSEKSSKVNVWTRVTMPDDAALKGTTLSLDLILNYVAPVMSGGSSFREEAGKFEEKPDLKMASPGAGTTYYRLAWLAVAGCLLTNIGSFMLYMATGNLKGNPHQSLVKEG